MPDGLDDLRQKRPKPLSRQMLSGIGFPSRVRLDTVPPLTGQEFMGQAGLQWCSWAILVGL